METVSNKSLWTLICSGGAQTEPGILESEILAQESLLSLGLASYVKNSKESLAKFQADKGVGGSWKEFVLKLSGVLGIAEPLSWNVLCNYLATEFRGTSQSLSDLLKNESQVKPLLVDIWHFYRAERLYLLQVLKEVITHHNNEEHEHREVFEKVFDKIDKEGRMKHELVDQFKEVISETPPSTEQLGSQLGAGVKKSWIHFNLREQSELLQLLLLYFHQTGEYLAGDWLILYNIFNGHNFGSSQLRLGEETEGCLQLGKAVAYLESAVLLQLLDLPGVAGEPDTHHIYAGDKAGEVEKAVSSLGDQVGHGPVLLGWMLGQLMARGNSGLEGARQYGDTALAGGVLTTLLEMLQPETSSHSLVWDILHTLVYGVMSALIQAFDPASLGLALDTHNLVVKLLSHKLIAAHFWKNPLGLSVYFDELKARFPQDQIQLVEVSVSLASASADSCSFLTSALSSLPCYTALLDSVPASLLRVTGGEYELSSHHLPYPNTQTVLLPAGTTGSLLSNGISVRWNSPQNGWQHFLAQVGELSSVQGSGRGYVDSLTLKRVTGTAQLVAALLQSDPSLAPQLNQITNALLVVAERYSNAPSPPLLLMSAVMEILASLVSNSPSLDLSSTSLLPSVSADGSLVPGVVGTLLAGQETLTGHFPCLTAFLHLVTVMAGEERSRSCLTFILSEVLPHYSQWRYESPGERDKIARLALSSVLQHSSLPSGLELMAGDSGLARALLTISATGDRVIQTLLELQTSWEAGRGSDLVSLVQLSLTILDCLVRSPVSGPRIMAGPVGAAIRSPPAGASSHYLLTLAHYTYFHHRPELATAAIKLLAGVAGGTSQVSVVACLGPAAPAVRDQLLARLESSTEDLSLKISVVELLVTSVHTQPGLLQLLTLTEEEGEGCLATVMRLLALCNQNSLTSPTWLRLHLSIVRLVDRLWSTGRLAATSHLKKQKNFWSELAKPLTEGGDSRADQGGLEMMEVKALVLRAISGEVYTWAGKMSDELQTVVTTICREQNSALAGWCEVEEEAKDETNIPLFLLTSWRGLLVVLSKDSPSSLPPATCRNIFSSCSSQLSTMLSQCPSSLVTLVLADTALVLARRWKSKTTENMVDWVGTVGSMLSTTSLSWTSLHPRTKEAVLGLALITLKMSDFKLGSSDSVLASWLAPSLGLLRTSLTQLTEEATLCLALTSGLVSRLPAQLWLPALHSDCTIQLLLSGAEHCITNLTHPSLASAILSLILEISVWPEGTRSLLLQNLDTQLWLPLSSVPANKETQWGSVREAALQVAGSLVRIGGRAGVDTAVTAVSLLQDRIILDLLGLKTDLRQVERSASTARLVWSLSEHVTVWLAGDTPSLQAVFSACSSVLQYCTALLLRPSLMSSLMSGPGEELDLQARRDRRLSSSYCEQDCDLLSPDQVSAQSFLLETVAGCLALFCSLSPPLDSLLAGEALLDPDRWHSLLSSSFSPPSLDQSELSYGVILSLANTCVRSVSRDSRSPSPSMASPLTDKMVLVLEMSLTLLVSQSLLSLASPRANTRDTQLLRRELGAELGSITDTWRRQGKAGRSPAPLRAARTSPAPPSPQQSRYKTESETFIKFISAVVNNVFK